MSTKITFSDSKKDCINVHFAFEGEKSPAHPPFYGKKFEIQYLPDKKLLFVGLGKKNEFNVDYYRRVSALAVKTASLQKIACVHFSQKDLTEKEIVLVCEGALLGNYTFDKYKTEKDKKYFLVKEISFLSYAKKFSNSLNDALFLCNNVYFVRDLVSENSDIVTPKFLETISRKLAKKTRMKINVLREQQLTKLGFNLLMSVAKGSDNPPRVIVLEYTGDTSQIHEKVLLAGKGVTFDSGGLNIKNDTMKDMRMDMAGAATVLGIMKSLSELKIKRNVIGIIGCVENMPDGHAYKPGDVIKSYSGKTVENLNCDAEGRLVLADVLSYGVKKYNPNLVLEFSTLTGNVVAALGHFCAGFVTNSPEHAKIISKAGHDTYELVWQLPLFEEYRELVKGERADLRSIAKNRDAGSIFGGAFLAEFVDNVPYVHVDIAGTAILEEPTMYLPKDGSGFGVRLGVEFLKNLK